MTPLDDIHALEDPLSALERSLVKEFIDEHAPTSGVRLTEAEEKHEIHGVRRP
jgi:hypothetical protein